jgi:hypothetical protein
VEPICEQKIVQIREFTVTLHGNERARAYFLRREEFISWALAHPPRGQNGIRRNVTAQPSAAANKGWRFSTRIVRTGDFPRKAKQFALLLCYFIIERSFSRVSFVLSSSFG